MYSPPWRLLAGQGEIASGSRRHYLKWDQRVATEVTTQVITGLGALKPALALRLCLVPWNVDQQHFRKAGQLGDFGFSALVWCVPCSLIKSYSRMLHTFFSLLSDPNRAHQAQILLAKVFFFNCYIPLVDLSHRTRLELVIVSLTPKMPLSCLFLVKCSYILDTHSTSLPPKDSKPNNRIILLKLMLLPV